MRYLDAPGHTTDLEVAQMLTVLLFSFPREFRGQELDRVHCRNEVVDMVLREVAAARRMSTRDKV